MTEQEKINYNAHCKELSIEVTAKIANLSKVEVQEIVKRLGL